MPVVLFSAPYMIPFLERFRPELEGHGIELIVPEVEERLEEAELLAYAGQFDGTVCGDDQYTRAVIEACTPRLKVISKWGTGIDSIDQKACSEYGVVIGNTPNAFTDPVADSVLGYILAFARQQPWLDRSVRKGTWRKIPGRSLSECTLGVIGIGNIGRAVLKRAKPFEMTLLGNDIQEIDPGFLSALGVEMVSLETLVSRADFISINCDLNPTSFQLVNEDLLQKMNGSAVIINTARGQIIQEAALISALANRTIAGAALDVFEQEPLPDDSPLRTFDHVMLAPHNANSSPRAWEAVHRNTLENLYQGLGLETSGKGKES